MDKLRLNSAIASLRNTPITSDERTKLIYEGQLLMLENMGRVKNRALSAAGRPSADFGSCFTNNGQFEAKARKWSDDVLCFCAKKANDFDDRVTDRNDRSTFTNPRLASSPWFLRTLGNIMNEVMYTVTPTLINEMVGEMCSVATTPKGKTYTIEITSNAVIQWEDATWTSLRSVPQDKLYNRTIAVNPVPKAARGSINFYQMVGNDGSLINTMAAMVGGYAAKLMQSFTTAFTTAAGDARYVPASLKATGYTGDNWATICQNTAKANRVRREQLVAWGDFLALRKVLPDNASLASAIMMQMGDEYFKTGYILSHDGVRMYEITPTSTPETINTTLTSVFPTDQIIIAARASNRYAPMVAVFEEGAESTLQLTPGDDVLATGNIEVLQVASYAIAPAFASRIGLMTNVV